MCKSLLNWNVEGISTERVRHRGMKLFNFKESFLSTFNYIPNIKAFLDEVNLPGLQNPSSANKTSLFQLLNNIDAVEQNEHPSQLL